ncbi:hypothetical protein [Paenibacillus dakarensis]|uniref:hypothetical protein n=1 Tax=Paenibacillus dakarensis TaxID=1527293 RepID=UPI0006D56119|nr:hypothetical protein [Paenibacillus dakarensis]
MAVNVKKLEETTNPFTKITNSNAAIQKLAQQRVQQQNTPVIKGTVTSVTNPSVQSVAANVSPNTMQSAKPSYMQEAQSLYEMMKNRATQPVREFSYDPQSDPAYQAALQRARSNIDAGNSQAQAEMNRRGILNSTITSDRMGEISSNEMGRVETDVLPSLMQAAYQRYADQIAQEQQQFQNLGSLYGMNIGEDQRGFDNKVTEAGLTGNYMPSGAQDIINNILDLKRQAEQKGLTAAERANLSARADGFRAQLSSMGIDPSYYGSNVNSKQASQTNPALRTLQGQQLDMQNKAANWSAAQSVWDASGRMVTPQRDWTGLIRQVQNGNAPMTMAAQQQQFIQNQQLTENQFRNEQFAYQKARDGISDQQWKAKFDEDVRQFGLSYGLQKLSEQNQQAYREAQIGLSQDDNARMWSQLDAELARSSSGGAAEYKGMSANQVYDAVRSRFLKTDNKSGKEYIPTDAGTKQKIYESVGGMGLPQGQDEQVMMMLGLTAADIAKYDKQYGVTSGN